MQSIYHLPSACLSASILSALSLAACNYWQRGHGVQPHNGVHDSMLYSIDTILYSTLIMNLELATIAYRIYTLHLRDKHTLSTHQARTHTHQHTHFLNRNC
jgi:hypothetical protein